jgi:hypothetical protein
MNVRTDLTMSLTAVALSLSNILAGDALAEGEAAATDRRYTDEYIVLTDQVSRKSTADPDSAIGKALLELDANGPPGWEAGLERIEARRAEMRARGYVVVGDGSFNLHDPLLNQIAQGDPPRSIEGEYGYPPADVVNGPFANGRLVAAYGRPHEDGLIHSTTHVFEFDELGQVIVEELSYATIPGVRIVVNRLSGNVDVNGHVAEYMALVNASGTRGQTIVRFLTGTKMFTLTTTTRILREDPAFQTLMALARALN